MEHLIQLTTILKERIKGPLPGWEAQRKMASRQRLSRLDNSQPPAGARIGSVLILLYPHQGKTCTVFIRRNEYDGIHSGQISFPGGQQESSDRSYAQTALREAWEETGIDPGKVEVLGQLTQLYIPPSNFMVFPVLGLSLERPQFRPDPSEVQEIIEVEIDKFTEPGILQHLRIDLPGRPGIEAPCYVIGSAVIWGATAMMMSELIELIG